MALQMNLSSPYINARSRGIALLPLATLLSTLFLSACSNSSNYASNDRQFTTWYKALIGDVSADPNYHRLPLDSNDQIHEFSDWLHAAYRGEITHDQFAERISQRYPGHQYETTFIVRRLPR